MLCCHAPFDRGLVFNRKRFRLTFLKILPNLFCAKVSKAKREGQKQELDLESESKANESKGKPENLLSTYLLNYLEPCSLQRLFSEKLCNTEVFLRVNFFRTIRRQK